MARIALNGLGRMGKLALRRLVDLEAVGDIVLINDAVGDPAMHAHLMEFDTVHGHWEAQISHDDTSLTIYDQRFELRAEKRIEDLPLAEMGIDLVIDCTGVFKTVERIEPYFATGVKHVVVSAPVKESEAANIVYGVNHQIYEGQRIVTAASCTTNCLAPVVKVIHEALGIRHGMITTLHDVTNTQTMVDKPAKDLRRARSALNSLIPTTTGSAKAITQIFPELTGRLNGHAVRVPLLNASLTDCVFEVERETSVGEVNALLQAAAEGELNGILGYETRPLVSSDYTNDSRSSIIDAPSTMVTGGTQVKIFAWYDNEWGYACRLADVARMAAASL